jgi:predicted transcriptional regulator YheO
MAVVSNPILAQYVKLTEFLGEALGPDYEVALHDLTNRERSIIAIANNHVSGREIGAPLTDMTLALLRDKVYETSDYIAHYCGVSVSGKELRSNTMFIKDRGQLIGLLCVNFDDSRCRDLCTRLMSLGHPDKVALDVFFPNDSNASAPSRPTENFRNSSADVVTDAIQRELDQLGVTADRLTSEERLSIIANLEKSGVFLMKGTVKRTAAQLQCSQASVYRYLSQVKNDGALV